jgi:hypothetical protein
MSVGSPRCSVRRASDLVQTLFSEVDGVGLEQNRLSAYECAPARVLNRPLFCCTWASAMTLVV